MFARVTVVILLEAYYKFKIALLAFFYFLFFFSDISSRKTFLVFQERLEERFSEKIIIFQDFLYMSLQDIFFKMSIKRCLANASRRRLERHKDITRKTSSRPRQHILNKSLPRRIFVGMIFLPYFLFWVFSSSNNPWYLSGAIFVAFLYFLRNTFNHLLLMITILFFFSKFRKH